MSWQIRENGGWRKWEKKGELEKKRGEIRRYYDHGGKERKRGGGKERKRGGGEEGEKGRLRGG